MYGLNLDADVQKKSRCAEKKPSYDAICEAERIENWVCGPNSPRLFVIQSNHLQEISNLVLH
jgi:hypothetical protein